MAETLPVVDQARIAEAVARLVARQAQLLSRADEDAGAAGAARMGLAWLAELLRSLDAPAAAAWFQALRERPDAWSALGAPACERLAAALEAAHALEPLNDGALDWDGRLAELAAHAGPAREPASAPEPVPAPRRARVAHPDFVVPISDSAAAPASIPAPAAAPASAPPATPAPSSAFDLGELAWRDDPRFAALHGVRIVGDPSAVDRLVRALSAFAANRPVRVDARNGRIEIAGTLELDDPGDALLTLDAAARAAGTVLVTAPRTGREQEWGVRAHAADGAQDLFVESHGVTIAVPWHRVVEFGLVPEGGGAHVLVGHGLLRISLPIDRLVSRGPAGPAIPHAAEGGDPFTLPVGLAWGAAVTDPEGRAARRLLVHEAQAVYETPRMPAPEPVQATALSADNASVSPPPHAEGLTALVADDSMMARVFLSRLLKERGIAVDEAEDGIIAIAHLSARAYDLVFLDVAMPGAGAFEIVEASGAALAARACVLVKDEDERRRAEAFGLAPVLLKPFAEDEVAGAIGALLAARHLRG